MIGDVALSVTSVGDPYEREGERVANIEVRAENVGQDEVTSPDFLLQCGAENQPFFAETTYSNGAPLPAGSFQDGTVVSAYPADCESPTVVTEFVVTFDTDPVAHWPLPVT